MGCCGGKREALTNAYKVIQPTGGESVLFSRERQPGRATHPPSVASDADPAASTVLLRYLRHAPAVLQGKRSGTWYRFTHDSPIQRVDERDAIALIRTSLFVLARESDSISSS